VRPDVLVIVLDASNLEQHLVFAQEVLELGRPRSSRSTWSISPRAMA
jgi:Fe2+ transport system protein B